jgi:hypothetical protein
MRIYIDFDDVLCETACALAGLAREMFGRQVPYEAISVFDLQEAFSLSDTELAALMERAHRDDVLADLAPTPGGLEAVRALEALGHEPVIVTGRPAASHPGSCGWLRRHGLAHLALLHVDKYGRVGSVGTVNAQRSTLNVQCDHTGLPATLDRAAFEALRFDVAIDDAPAALDLLAPRRDCLVIVYDRPWNRRYAHAPNMRRAGSWSEIAALIGGLP